MAGTHRLHWPLLITLVAALLAGCGGPAPAATPPGELATEIPSNAPTAPALAPTPFPPPTGAPSGGEQAPAPPPGVPAVPYDMTGFEMIAASVGTAAYSGYGCLLSPVGCACELPSLQQVTFNFRPDGKLDYHFESEGYATTWEMSRVAPNQWEYTISLFSEERGAQIGEGRVLLSLTEDGYVFAQIVDFYEQGLVTCPEVNFRRLMSAGDE